MSVGRLSYPAHGAVQLSEHTFLSHFNLRGNPQDPMFTDAVASVLGVELPLTPNTIAEAQGRVVYWLGPNEWLIVSHEAPALVQQPLASALAGQFYAITELSSGQTVLNLSGVQALGLLQRGCPLDLHPAQFKPGQCAQSLLAKAPILVRPLADDHYQLIVRRSFTDYLWSWIEEVCRINQWPLAVTRV